MSPVKPCSSAAYVCFCGSKTQLQSDLVAGNECHRFALEIHIICVFLQGVLSLKKSCFKPQYILIIPTRVETYTDHLNSRGLYTRAQIDVAVSRVELYNSFNAQRPGFFDKVLPGGTKRQQFITVF